MDRFIQVPEWVAKRLNTLTQYKVWCALWLRSDKDTRECYPGQQKISEDAGLSVRAVQRAVAQMVGMGVIEVTVRSFKTNLYRLVTDDPGVTTPVASGDRSGSTRDVTDVTPPVSYTTPVSRHSCRPYDDVPVVSRPPLLSSKQEEDNKNQEQDSSLRFRSVGEAVTADSGDGDGVGAVPCPDEHDDAEGWDDPQGPKRKLRAELSVKLLATAFTPATVNSWHRDHPVLVALREYLTGVINAHFDPVTGSLPSEIVNSLSLPESVGNVSVASKGPVLASAALKTSSGTRVASQNSLEGIDRPLAPQF